MKQEEQVKGDDPVAPAHCDINRIPDKVVNDLRKLSNITGHDIDALAAGWWLRISEVQTLQIESSYKTTLLEASESENKSLREALEELRELVRQINAGMIHFSTLDKMPTLGLLDREGLIKHVVKIGKEKVALWEAARKLVKK